MGRGVSSGGGQSSLNYLFRSGEPKPTTGKTEVVAEAPAPARVNYVHVAATNEPSPNLQPLYPRPILQNRHLPGSEPRVRSQNTGNFLTDQPSTKVHAAPGGGSSSGYLFGDGRW